MIFDELSNLRRYSSLSPNFKKAIEFILDTDFTDISTGKIIVDPDNVICTIVDHNLEKQNNFWESHKLYADIHFVVSGNEIIRYTPIPAVEVSPYSSDNDSTIFSGCTGVPVQFDMRKNQFLIFFPGEIHQTNNQSPESPHVKKVILKVRC